MSTKSVKIWNKLEKAIGNVLYSYYSAHLCFENERDVECTLFAELYQEDMLSEAIYPQVIEGEKFNDCLLHCQSEKDLFDKKGKLRKSKGKFDLVIYDPNSIGKGEYDNLFAIEIKYNHNFNDKDIRKDVSNMMKHDNCKRGILINLNLCNRGIGYSNQIKKNFSKAIKKIQSSQNTSVLYYYAYVNDKDTSEKGLVIYHIFNDNGKIRTKELLHKTVKSRIYTKNWRIKPKDWIPQ